MQNSTRPRSSPKGFCEAVGACCAVSGNVRCDGKLLSPKLRRKTVIVLQDRFKVYQRRAYRLARQKRNKQGWPTPIEDLEEGKLRSRIRQLARHHGRWGRRLDYRRLTNNPKKASIRMLGNYGLITS